MDNSKLLRLDDIVSWYESNVDTKINKDFLNHLVKIDLLDSKSLFEDTIELLFSLDDVNDLLLEKKDNEYVKNNKGLFVVKENRKQRIFDFYKKEEKQESIVIVENDNINIPIKNDINIIDNKKKMKNVFKIKHIDGNKLKLTKIK